jgi:hypothetical protein
MLESKREEKNWMMRRYGADNPMERDHVEDLDEKGA